MSFPKPQPEKFSGSSSAKSLKMEGMTESASKKETTTRKVPTYCYQCVAGPDLLNVVVEDDVAVKVEPNFDFKDQHPAGGRPCVRAYGLVQKMYNPNRIKAPMKRTNPKKGKDQDPRWVEISWDEALDLLARKLQGIRAKGMMDE